MKESLSQNKWKVMTFGLLGFILLGAILPQATAATDISQLTQQILSIVKSTTYGNQAIMNAITGLRGSSANATSVNNLQTSVNDLKGNVTELSEKVDALADNSGAFTMLGGSSIQPFSGGGFHQSINCVSDHPYKLYVHIRDDSDNDDDKIVINGFNYWGNADYDVVVGGRANQTISLNDFRDGETGAYAIIYMETAQSATASCLYP
jgi:hypothetical protein